MVPDSPKYFEHVASRTPTLTWHGPSITAGPVHYTVYIDGQPAGAVDDNGCASSCSFTAPELTEAQHTWKVVATDADGSAETETRTFTVDVTIKILSFHIAEPWTWHGLGPAVSVIHGPQCPRAGVTTDDIYDGARFTLDGEPYDGSMGLSRSLACHLAAGPHTIVATAIDQAGNTATASLVFQTDLVRPEVRIEEPTRLVKGTTATFRAVADPSTVVGPPTFTWVRGLGVPPCPCEPMTDELQVPVDFDTADLTIVVSDAEGDVGSKSVHLVATPKPPRGAVGVAVGRGGYSTARRTKLRLVWPAGATQVTLTNPADGKSQTFPVAASIPWKLAATGRTTVRAQFDWPLPATTYTANVIVDTKRPELTSAVSRGATVRLHARDTGSGLANVQVAARRSHPARPRPYRSTLRTRASWVRVTDKAGNRSAWHRISHSG
jgi:hypothetical protein